MRAWMIVSILLLLGGLAASAQEVEQNRSVGVVESIREVAAPRKAKHEARQIYRTPEVMPKPEYSMAGYLSKMLHYPEKAYKNEIQGKIVVEFVVERDGSLTNVKVINGAEVGHGIPEEAIRVIKAMPKWKPGRQNGKVVRAYYTMPILFKLE